MSGELCERGMKKFAIIINTKSVARDTLCTLDGSGGERENLKTLLITFTLKIESLREIVIVLVRFKQIRSSSEVRFEFRKACSS